jgi:glyoxylate utilization-related uncharacterized protein
MFQEAFYIIDGEIKVITNEKTYIATKGSYVNISLVDLYINLLMKQEELHMFSVHNARWYGKNVRRNRRPPILFCLFHN